MLEVSALAIAVELIADEHGPMLLVSVRLSLEEALTLEAAFALVLLDVAEAHQRLIVINLAHVVHVLALHAKTAVRAAIVVHTRRHSIHKLHISHLTKASFLMFCGRRLKAARSASAKAPDARRLSAVDGRELPLELLHFLTLIFLISKIDSLLSGDFALLLFVESLELAAACQLVRRLGHVLVGRVHVTTEVHCIEILNGVRVIVTATLQLFYF